MIHSIQYIVLDIFKVYNKNMIMKRKIRVENTDISIKKVADEDYLSLTDMVKVKDGDFFISDWLRNRNTLEFLGTWESIYNPNFNYGEFAIIKNNAGLNNFKISVKEWSKKTNAIGLIAATGRYGGTYAHKDIAFEFGMWISAPFKLYLIKEYQRLIEIENNQYNLEWNISRTLSKVNYAIHTDAIKEQIIPKVPIWRKGITYANEADLINLALFGMTAKEWRKNHPKEAKIGKNIRDTASINELIIISNLETHNAQMVKEELSQEERFNKLVDIARSQRKSLHNANLIKSIKKLNEETYHLAIKNKIKPE